MQRTTAGALLLAFALLAAACSSGESAESTTTVPDATTTTAAPAATSTTAAPTTTTTTTAPIPPLVVWADARLAGVLEGYAADFEVATGIPVQIEVQELDAITPAAAEAIAGGAGPDVFYGSHRAAAALAADGAVVAIPIPDPEAYVTGALEAFTPDGDLVGLPFEIVSPGLYANTALVPEDALEGTDLDRICEDAEHDGQCLALPSDDPVTALAVVRSFGGYGYGYAYGEEGWNTADIGLDSAGGLAAADYLDARALLGSLMPSADAKAAFASGRAAFLVGPPSADPGPSEWAAVPFYPAGSDAVAAAAEVYGFMVSSTSGQPVAARVFLTEFAGRDAPMFDLFLAGFTVPARLAAYDDAVATDPRIAAFAPAGAASVLPWDPEAGDLLDALGEAVARIASGGYTDAVADARAAFSAAAASLRPDGG